MSTLPCTDRNVGDTVQTLTRPSMLSSTSKWLMIESLCSDERNRWCRWSRLLIHSNPCSSIRVVNIPSQALPDLFSRTRTVNDRPVPSGSRWQQYQARSWYEHRCSSNTNTICSSSWVIISAVCVEEITRSVSSDIVWQLTVRWHLDNIHSRGWRSPLSLMNLLD